MQTAQMIGSLIIRFVVYAESGLKWKDFPDKPLLDAILNNCADRELAEQHLTALLFHHSKIMDNCGSKNKVRSLIREAFPKQLTIEAPKWEIV